MWLFFLKSHDQVTIYIALYRFFSVINRKMTESMPTEFNSAAKQL